MSGPEPAELESAGAIGRLWQWLQPIKLSVLPGALIGLGYFVCLGHRHDYLGHYAAGFGATLMALSVACRNIPEERFVERAAGRILWLTLACIAAGGFAEATGFNIAKFDEVDFCNQSLGATLADLGFLARLKRFPPDSAFLERDLYAGVIALHVGFFFAMF